MLEVPWLGGEIPWAVAMLRDPRRVFVLPVGCLVGIEKLKALNGMDNLSMKCS